MRGICLTICVRADGEVSTVRFGMLDIRRRSSCPKHKTLSCQDEQLASYTYTRDDGLTNCDTNGTAERPNEDEGSGARRHILQGHGGLQANEWGLTKIVVKIYM